MSRSETGILVTPQDGVVLETCRGNIPKNVSQVLLLPGKSVSLLIFTKDLLTSSLIFYTLLRMTFDKKKLRLSHPLDNKKKPEEYIDLPEDEVNVCEDLLLVKTVELDNQKHTSNSL